MENLIHTQIHQGCKLTLPDGLKELMADISREVLRAQPENLYKFISDYLAALLVTREHLHIASRICGEACDSLCQPTLVDELRAQGLGDEAEKAAEIIVTYFDEGGNREDNVMLKLIKNTNITEKQLCAVRLAIENTFLKQRLKATVPEKSLSDSSVDSIAQAVQHTMKLYEITKPSQEDYANMAVKIEAAYRGYGVQNQSPDLKTTRPQSSSFSEDTKPCFRFPENSCYSRNIELPKLSKSSTLSSDHRPLHQLFYISDNDDLDDFSDLLERENSSFDYTTVRYTVDSDKSHLYSDNVKKISFNHPVNPDIIEYDDNSDNESTYSITKRSEKNYTNVTKSNFSKDNKVMDDVIAELDENIADKIYRNDTFNQNDLETSKVLYASLTAVKESKRFVADDETELGDTVDHCHISVSTDTFNAMAKRDSELNHKKVSLEELKGIEEANEFRKLNSFETEDSVASKLVDGLMGTVEMNDLISHAINTPRGENFTAEKLEVEQLNE